MICRIPKITQVAKRVVAAAAVALALGPASPAIGDRALISIDGEYEDWAGIESVHIDPPGDGSGTTGIDFGKLWLTDDERFLFMRFEVGDEIDLSEDNNLVLYLDTDVNSGTGYYIGGIGAELVWRFGLRNGIFYHAGGSSTVYHNHIRFRACPTVTATAFEAAIGLMEEPDGSHALFTGPEVRMLLVDDSTSGDWLPDLGVELRFTLGVGTLPPDPPREIDRLDDDDLRLTTWNVENDSPWNPSDADRIGRQLAALDPDIINFQEIYDHTPEETAAFVEQFLPSGPDEDWHAAGNFDCKTISRYPVLDSWILDGNLATLIDLTGGLGGQMLLFNAHLPCCTDDDGRQQEIDHILGFIHDALVPGGVIDLPVNTPIHITGDLNLVGLSQQLTSLLTGDIVDEGTYGPDFSPDWDGSDLTDVISRQTEKRMAYTWRRDTSSFWPGRLDLQIHTDSVLDVVNDYILYTPEMSSELLVEHGLQSGDSLAVDHLLFCVDYRRAGVLGDINGDGTVDVLDLLELLGAWGPCSDPPAECPSDLDDNGTVNVLDLLILLSNWTSRGG